MDNLISNLELQYRKFSKSENFHNDTKIFEKGKTTPFATWPDSWKKIYTKGYPRLKQIYLEKNYLKLVNKPLKKVLLERATCREFNNDKLTFKNLSALLYYSCGIKPIKDEDFDLSRRFYPSGGARYPLEVYCILYNKNELKNGIYHFNVRRNSLELLKEGNYIKELKKALDPKWMDAANVAIIITSVFGRNQVKYKDRGYRFILQESGHLSQNIHLVATALNLGCCALGGFVDDKVNELLDIDGVNESAVYTLIIGLPKNKHVKK